MSRHPEASAVINVVRMFCYRQGVLHLEHCSRQDAKRRRIELSTTGLHNHPHGASVMAPVFDATLGGSSATSYISY